VTVPGKALLNVGVIGVGRMGSVHARHLANAITGARLSAIADLKPEVREAFTRELDLDPSRVFERWEDLVALKDIDAVVVTVPTVGHGKVVLGAAAQKKAIFCEKPLCLTVAETREVLPVVEKAGVPLQVGFMRRFDPGYARAKELIDAGQIGDPTIFKSISRDPFCPPPAFADPSQSGGLIVDLSIHDVDLARWLVGSEVKQVSAEGVLRVCEKIRVLGDIDNAVVNMRFENGSLGNIETSRHAFYGYDVRSEVLGSKGGLHIGMLRYTPVLVMTREGGVQHDVVPYFLERFGEAYRREIQHFVDAIRAQRAPSITGRDGLYAIEIGAAATYSAKVGGPPVTIESVRANSAAADEAVVLGAGDRGTPIATARVC
jgi:inositol 2-dehydrogenase